MQLLVATVASKEQQQPTSIPAVWISRDVTVGFLLYRASVAVSVAIFSKISAGYHNGEDMSKGSGNLAVITFPVNDIRSSPMKEFNMDIALEEIPVSGCTCFSTCVNQILLHASTVSTCT